MRYLKILLLWLLLSLQACGQMTITPIMQGFTPSLVLDFTRGTLPVGLTFTRSSIATRVNASGNIETVAADQPRFDYDPVTLQARGILIEEARTNMFTNSGDVTGAGWGVTNATITPNQPGPFGVTNAQKITGNAVSNSRLGISQTRTLTAGQTYTFSVYLKAGERNTATIFFNSGNTSPLGYKGSAALLNLTTGVSSEPAIVSLIPTGNGWYRAVCTALIGGTGDQAIQQFITLGAPNANSGDGVSGIYVWGAQLEVGAFATSYIPTTASSVTRAADVLSMPFGSWFNPTEGAWLADADQPQIVSFNASTL